MTFCLIWAIFSHSDFVQRNPCEDLRKGLCPAVFDLRVGELGLDLLTRSDQEVVKDLVQRIFPQRRHDSLVKPLERRPMLLRGFALLFGLLFQHQLL